ncbi:MAG: 50S ribosomal protein L16 [bacterium]|nr:50S ribosomal protein L16 [bacterium]
MPPKRQKYRKQFRGKRRGVSSRGNTVDFGEYGLKSLAACWLTEKQLEAARRAVAHTTKRGGKIWVRVFPDKPVSARAAGVRMGGGKGDVKEFVTVIQPGRIILEIAGVSEELAKEALRSASAKLPIATRIVARE